MISTDHHLPLAALYGNLPGVGAGDARAFIDSLVARHFAEYSNDLLYYDLIKWHGGYAYEIKVGGDGLSEIRAITKYLDEHPDEKVYCNTAERQAELALRPDGDTRIVFRILPEDKPRFPVTDLGKLPRAKLLTPTYRGILGAGFSFASLGVVLLAAAVMSMQLIASNDKEVDMSQTHDRVIDLPIWHTPGGVHLGPDQYIGRIQYQNGHWLPPMILCGGPACQVKPVNSGLINSVPDQQMQKPKG